MRNAKRRIKYSVFFLMIVFLLFFEQKGSSVYGASPSSELIWLDDGAQLYTDGQKQEIDRKLQQIRSEKKVDTVIVTVNSTQGKSSRDFADDYLDQGGYGYGPDQNAVLLLIDMGEREIYISTKGSGALQSFTDRRIDRMLDRIAEDLQRRDYIRCAQNFMDDVSEYMGDDSTTASKGPVTAADVLLRLVIALAIGGAVSLVTWGVLRRGTPAVANAGDYLDEDSVKILTSEDRLINSVTTTRHIQRDSGSGTSTHRSSSGQIHGGGGRRF